MTREQVDRAGDERFGVFPQLWPILDRDGRRALNKLWDNLRKEIGVRTLHASSQRILVQHELTERYYLYHFMTQKNPVRVPAVIEYLEVWREFKNKPVYGHILLFPFVAAPKTVDCPSRSCAVLVGHWAKRNRVPRLGVMSARRVDPAMLNLLRCAGVAGVAISRVRRYGAEISDMPAEAEKRLDQSEVSARVGNSNDEATSDSYARGLTTHEGRSRESWQEAGVAKRRPRHSDRMPQRGMSIDAYKLVQRLGRGVSAEVWRAKVEEVPPGVEDLKVGEEVAIKIYSRALLSGFQPLRVQREFTVAAELDHPNLAKVYDVVLSPSRPFHTFLVMEYLQGKTLKSYVSPLSPMPTSKILRVGTQLFSALREIHSMNAIHRDVKAANIMVTNPDEEDIQIKLLDFGIVSVEEDAVLTKGSVFLGSKHSAPYEQLTGRPLDYRADIYAAGTVLYHCYSGRPLYEGIGPEGAIVARMLQHPQTLNVRRDGEGPAEEKLVTFINKCIEVDQVKRPASADACIQELQLIATVSPESPQNEQRRATTTEEAATLDDPIRQLRDSMIGIRGGQFDMGSTEETDEQPVHSVTLQGFEMSAMPVTQAQYAAVMGNNPSSFKGDDLPVESVSWQDAMEFCERLSKKTGRAYTLPTEAQWEYACRAGSTARYCFGDDESLLADYAWYRKNSERTTHPVGKKKPNDWGLYDMHGNVWEWCLDRWDEDYKNAPDDGRVRESDEGSRRVFRGGSWGSSAELCRCSYRGGYHPDYRYDDLGFRVVLVPSSGARGSERSELLQ